MISTKPVAVDHVPTPAIVIVTPVPDASVTFQESLTVVLLPAVTALGDAVNELIGGGGHAPTVTITCLELDEPQPLVAISV